MKRQRLDLAGTAGERAARRRRRRRGAQRPMVASRHHLDEQSGQPSGLLPMLEAAAAAQMLHDALEREELSSYADAAFLGALAELRARLLRGMAVVSHRRDP